MPKPRASGLIHHGNVTHLCAMVALAAASFNQRLLKFPRGLVNDGVHVIAMLFDTHWIHTCQSHLNGATLVAGAGLAWT